MERYNLKSSIEFGYLLKDKTDCEYRQLRDSYDSFLKQPLTLGMFVPCDEDGNVLETYDPRYQQAKERVLFEFQLEYLGWDNSDMENSIIEDLLTDGYDYTLTPYALKQIGI